MDAVVLSKIVSMVCLGLVTWIVGVLPLLGVRMGWLREKEQSRRTVIIISCMMSFGGGVILTSCLTHMLPDVNDVLEEAQNNILVVELQSWTFKMDKKDLVACVSFMFKL